MRVREEQVKGLNDNLRLLSLQLDELNKTIETVKRSKVRRAKLYYLRGRSAKEMRIKEKKKVVIKKKAK